MYVEAMKSRCGRKLGDVAIPYSGKLSREKTFANW